MLKKKNNKIIYKIFLDDQKDHSAVKIRTYNDEKDWVKLTKRDIKRQRDILKILKNKKFTFTGEDYFMAGIIFQHGTTITDSKKAIALAKKGAGMGNDKAKWLYTAATDRLLIRQKKKQKFGTQYQKKDNKWRLYPVDKKTTDKERTKYNVVSLKEARAKAEKWNRKGIDPWDVKRKTAGITSRK
jgi:hypothetical protein